MNLEQNLKYFIKYYAKNHSLLLANNTAYTFSFEKIFINYLIVRNLNLHLQLN